jgi:hypothetical protein
MKPLLWVAVPLLLTAAAMLIASGARTPGNNAH